MSSSPALDKLINESVLCVSEDTTSQAVTLAKDIAGKLRAAIEEKGWASIAFSGGRTPTQMLQILVKEQLDWGKVYITLVDDRCVDMESERSNARLLKENFLDNVQSQPAFYPLYVKDESISGLEGRFETFHLPLDVVHLGMGEDAHTASFFPDAPNIADMLSSDSRACFIATQSLSSVEPRITWTLSALLKSRYIALQCNGAAKKEVLATVLNVLSEHVDNDVSSEQREKLPILSVLEQSRIHKPNGLPISIYHVGDG